MLRNIKLYGHLGKRFGKLHRLAVKTPAEAIAALRANFPDFPKAVVEHAPGYHVLIGKRDINGTQLTDPCGQGDIKIIPAVQGAKKGGVFQTILGIAMVVVGYFVPGVQGLIPAGISMIAGGVVQMLTRSPRRQNGEKAQNAPSYSFNGPVNTTTQGNPVPICYGEMIVGSQVASFGLSIENMYIGNPVENIPTFPDGTPRGDGLPQGTGSAQIAVTQRTVTGRPRSWDYTGDYMLALGLDNTRYMLNHNWNYTLQINLISTDPGIKIVDVPYDAYERCFHIDLNAYPLFADVTVGQQIWVLRGSEGGVPVWGTPWDGDGKPIDAPITQM